MALDFARIRESFFDSPKVLREVKREKRRMLSKMGAFTRATARRSMRKRKKPASAGEPPSVHEGSYKRLTFFAWDPVRESVVVGAIPFKSSSMMPELTEHGGDTTQKTDRGLIHRNYKPHPAMRLAMNKELPKFASMFKGQ